MRQRKKRHSRLRPVEALAGGGGRYRYAEVGPQDEELAASAAADRLVATERVCGGCGFHLCSREGPCARKACRDCGRSVPMMNQRCGDCAFEYLVQKSTQKAAEGSPGERFIVAHIEPSTDRRGYTAHLKHEKLGRWSMQAVTFRESCPMSLGETWALSGEGWHIVKHAPTIDGVPIVADPDLEGSAHQAFTFKKKSGGEVRLMAGLYSYEAQSRRIEALAAEVRRRLARRRGRV